MKDSKKILFVISDANCRGGTEVIAYSLLEQLQYAGYECLMFSRHIYNGDNPNIISLTVDEYTRYIQILNSPINKLLNNTLSDKWIRRILCRIVVKYKIICVLNHTYDLIGSLPFCCTNTPVLQISHWSLFGYDETLKIQARNKSFLKRSISCLAINSLIKYRKQYLRKLDNVIVLTNSAKQELRRYIDISDDRISVISNPLPYISDSKYHSNLNNNTISFVGRLSHEKGIMRLLRIWDKISKVLPSITLQIFGEGDGKKEMEEYINSRKIPNVRFMGYVSDSKQIYLNSDLCCVTSDSEGFGMVIIEAMYYGVPCISFDCPVSPKELIGDSGIIVPCFDEELYAKWVIRLLQNKTLLRSFQTKAIINVRKFYMNNIIAKWTNLLNSLNNES